MSESEPFLDKPRLVLGAHLVVALALAGLGTYRILAVGNLGGLINIGVGALVGFLGYRLSTVV